MLVLTRKPGEKVQVGGNVIFTVLEIRANRVRIGIDAPFEVPIFREELRTLQAETSTSNKVQGLRV